MTDKRTSKKYKKDTNPSRARSQRRDRFSSRDRGAPPKRIKIDYNGWDLLDEDLSLTENKADISILSRFEILKLLKTSSLSLEEIKDKFSYDFKKLNALEKRLDAMCRARQLREKSGKFTIDSSLIVRLGAVFIHKEGYGFVDFPDGSSAFLTKDVAKYLMDGDRILVSIRPYREGKFDATMINVVERYTKVALMSITEIKEKTAYLVPKNGKIPTLFKMELPSDVPLKPSDIVQTDIAVYPDYRTPIGLVTFVRRFKEDEIASMSDVEYLSLLHNIPLAFSLEALREAEMSDEIIKNEEQHRENLQSLPFITIDGADAKDFDDAVYATETATGFSLYVAIADVSFFVKEKTKLDIEALSRGTSIYFADRVVPMLPENLSNNLCSLMPFVPRLVHVCQMNIDKDGEIEDYKFLEATIKSARRCTYEEVESFLEGKLEFDSKIANSINVLKKITDKRLVLREERGALNFEFPEMKAVIQDGKITGLKIVEHLFSHMLIEECMVATNICAAHLISDYYAKGIYRVHMKMDNNRILELKEILSPVLPDIDWSDKHILQLLISKLKNHPLGSILQLNILRSLKQAYYCSKNFGHFGLALTHYSHFTSPIRRYADLIAHRLIKNIETKQPLKANLDDICLHISTTERRADDVSMKVLNIMKFNFLQKMVGDNYNVAIINKKGGMIQLYWAEYDISGSLIDTEQSLKNTNIGETISAKLASLDATNLQATFEI